MDYIVPTHIGLALFGMAAILLTAVAFYLTQSLPQRRNLLPMLAGLLCISSVVFGGLLYTEQLIQAEQGIRIRTKCLETMNGADESIKQQLCGCASRIIQNYIDTRALVDASTVASSSMKQCFDELMRPSQAL